MVFLRKEETGRKRKCGCSWESEVIGGCSHMPEANLPLPAPQFPSEQD